MAAIPLFDSEYPRVTLPFAFTPKKAGRRRFLRTEYPYDPHVTCLVLLPSQFYVVEKSSVPGMIGFPVAIAYHNTEVWRRAELNRDAFRVNHHSAGIRSLVGKAVYGKAAKGLVERIRTDLRTARNILSQDPVDFGAWGQLSAAMKAVITEPYATELRALGVKIHACAEDLSGGDEPRKIRAEYLRQEILDGVDQVISRD